MSERDLQRIEVLGEVLRGQRTITSAATVLALSARQVHRLLRRYREYGAGGGTHRARGRRANNRTYDGVREHAIELVRTNLSRTLGRRWPPEGLARSTTFRFARNAAPLDGGQPAVVVASSSVVSVPSSRG